MKSAKGLGLFLVAGLAVTAALASCKKPAPAPENVVPAAPAATAMPLPGGATDQMNAPAQQTAVPAPAPAGQPAPAATPSH